MIVVWPFLTMAQVCLQFVIAGFPDHTDHTHYFGYNKDIMRQSACLVVKVSKDAKIRNRYNQVPHLTQDTNGKVTNSKTPQTRAKRSALSQQVTTKHI